MTYYLKVHVKRAIVRLSEHIRSRSRDVSKAGDQSHVSLTVLGLRVILPATLHRSCQPSRRYGEGPG